MAPCVGAGGKASTQRVRTVLTREACARRALNGARYRSRMNALMFDVGAADDAKQRPGRAPYPDDPGFAGAHGTSGTPRAFHAAMLRLLGWLSLSLWPT